MNSPEDIPTQSLPHILHVTFTHNVPTPTPQQVSFFPNAVSLCVCCTRPVLTAESLAQLIVSMPALKHVEVISCGLDYKEMTGVRSKFTGIKFSHVTHPK